MVEEEAPVSDLSATEFLSSLATRLEAEAEDKEVAEILAQKLVVKAASVDEVVGALNALATSRSKDGGSDHG